MSPAPMTLWVRDNPITSAENQANDVKTTFSSWDNCMEKDYCKIPAIVLIVVGSLIVLSVVWCLVRCLCCGLECCCGCCSCLNACCSCCQPRGGRRYRDRDEPMGGYGGAGTPYNNTGYAAPPPAPVYVNVQAPAYNPGREYAAFDAPSKRPGAGARSASSYSNSAGAHEDALPSMPTWNDAHTHHEEEEVEMDHLGHYPDATEAPMLAHQAPDPTSAAPVGGVYGGQHHQQQQYHDNGHHDAAHYSGDLGDPYSTSYAGTASYGETTSTSYTDTSYQGHHTVSPPAHGAYAPPQHSYSSAALAPGYSPQQQTGTTNNYTAYQSHTQQY